MGKTCHLSKRRQTISINKQCYQIHDDIIRSIIYCIKFFAVRKYTQEISDQYSNTEKINLSWLYYLIAGLALIWVAVIIRNDILIFFFHSCSVYRSCCIFWHQSCWNSELACSRRYSKMKKKQTKKR